MDDILDKFPICDNIPADTKTEIKLFYVFRQYDSDYTINLLFATNDDKVYGLGDNTNGCLGLGHNEDVIEPQLIPELCNKNISEFYNGNGFVLALTKKQEVFCWGKNDYGQLGRRYKSEPKEFLIPEKVQTLKHKKITQVSCGFSHCLALTSTGVVYGWGYNYSGQLGCGNEQIIPIPKNLNNYFEHKIETIYCFNDHSFAILTNGNIFSWGDNTNRQLGTPSDSVLTPKLLNIRNISMVCSNKSKTYFLDNDGSIHFCGLLNSGEFQPLPKRLEIQNKFKEVHSILSLVEEKNRITALSGDKIYVITGDISTETNYKSFFDYYLYEYEITYKTITINDIKQTEQQVLPPISPESSTSSDCNNVIINDPEFSPTVIEVVNAPANNVIEKLAQNELDHLDDPQVALPTILNEVIQEPTLSDKLDLVYKKIDSAQKEEIIEGKIGPDKFGFVTAEKVGPIQGPSVTDIAGQLNKLKVESPEHSPTIFNEQKHGASKSETVHKIDEKQDQTTDILDKPGETNKKQVTKSNLSPRVSTVHKPGASSSDNSPIPVSNEQVKTSVIPKVIEQDTTKMDEIVSCYSTDQTEFNSEQEKTYPETIQVEHVNSKPEEQGLIELTNTVATNNEIPPVQLNEDTESEESIFYNNHLYEDAIEQIELIGVGSFGEVFKVKDRFDKAFYAVKKIDLEKKDDALKEVRNLAKINGECIAKYKHSWLEDGIIYIKMELCQDNLKNILALKAGAFGRPLNAVEYYFSTEILKEILQCVTALHEWNPPIIHRDIKPSNILISYNYRNGKYLKISDFGLATLMENLESIYKTKSRTGTFKYMAPEILNGKRYNCKADIFSLGIIAEDLFVMDLNKSKTREKSNEFFENNLSVLEGLIQDMCATPVWRNRPTCNHLLDRQHEWAIDANAVKNSNNFTTIMSKLENNANAFFYTYLCERLNFKLE